MRTPALLAAALALATVGCGTSRDPNGLGPPPEAAVVSVWPRSGTTNLSRFLVGYGFPGAWSDQAKTAALEQLLSVTVVLGPSGQPANLTPEVVRGWGVTGSEPVVGGSPLDPTVAAAVYRPAKPGWYAMLVRRFDVGGNGPLGFDATSMHSAATFYYGSLDVGGSSPGVVQLVKSSAAASATTTGISVYWSEAVTPNGDPSKVLSVLDASGQALPCRVDENNLSFASDVYTTGLYPDLGLVCDAAPAAVVAVRIDDPPAGLTGIANAFPPTNQATRMSFFIMGRDSGMRGFASWLPDRRPLAGTAAHFLPPAPAPTPVAPPPSNTAPAGCASAGGASGLAMLAVLALSLAGIRRRTVPPKRRS